MSVRARGIYIVSETNCLNPGSGAFQHIQVGMNELSKVYEINLLQFCRPYIPVNSGPMRRGLRKQNQLFSWLKKNVFFFKTLIKNHIGFLSYYRQAKSAKPQFIYERASYLNFNGLLIARLLRIPIFFEVNGILYKDYRKYTTAFLSRIARSLENRAYCSADHVFFVGGISAYFRVAQERSSSIQNGIENEFLENFRSHVKTFSDVIHVVFVGHGMPHHKLEVMVKASHLLLQPERFHFHFVGKSLEEYISGFNVNARFTYHGMMTHAQLAQFLKKCHVGVVPYLEDYFSNFKVFMYGAAKLLVLMPLLGNFEKILSPEHVEVIENADANDLAFKLNRLVDDPTMIELKGARLFQEVDRHYTWSRIFQYKIGIIHPHLAKDLSVIKLQP